MSTNSGSPVCRADNDQRIVELHWPNGETSRFHFVWLRHSARCADGMPNDTRVKIDLLPDDPLSLRVAGCRLLADDLLIDWMDDGLQTRHHLETLYRSSYDDAFRRRKKHRPRLWDGDSAGDIPVFDYEDLDDDEHRLGLLRAVRDFGVARLRRVPIEAGSLVKVSGIFGPTHVNNYGEIFDVRSDANMNLGSNTGVPLPPHTDESYRHDAPGISFFHCLEAASAGGESILVDGFKAAQRLRESDPPAFDVLSSVPVYFQRYAPPDEDMRSHTRILVTDLDGDVVGLRWTDRTLPPQDLPSALVEPVYRAIRALWKIVNAPEMQFCYRLEAGDMHVFDNHRILHGRRGFDPREGARHLQQCSVNRDEFHNRLRLLAAKLGREDADWVMAGGAVG